MRTRTEGVNKARADLAGTNDMYIARVLKSSTPIYFPTSISHYKVTVDEIHPNFPREGGPFDSRDITANFTDTGKIETGNCYYNGYVLNCERRVAPLSSNSLPPSSSPEALAQGPTGWDRFRPAKPQVNLAQALVELRDFNKLFKFKLNEFKNLGDDYLNVQFGWKPFLSDIRRTFQSYKRLDEHMSRLKKNNGKWLRRGGTLYSNIETAQDKLCAVYPSNGLTSIVLESEVTTEETCWFKGAFRYYIPGLQEGKWGKFDSLQQLWGLKVTPRLVYEVIPWSWLLDWVSDVGSVISNFTAINFENQAAKYAYVMCTQSTHRKSSASFNWSSNIFGVPKSGSASCSSTISSVSKARVVASPYGFNLDWSGFNPFQLSILAALGISRFG